MSNKKGNLLFKACVLVLFGIFCLPGILKSFPMPGDDPPVPPDYPMKDFSPPYWSNQIGANEPVSNFERQYPPRPMPQDTK